MIGIIDYGVGNLYSLKRSLEYLGLKSKIITCSDEIKKADRLILPGVGAFGDAVEKLKKSSLCDALKTEAKGGKPILGICLGMQLLFNKSYEYGTHQGLNLIKGDVKPINEQIKCKNLKVPHIGWNGLEIRKKSPLLKYIKQNDYVYFVHSYAVDCDKKFVLAYSDYGMKIVSAVANGNIYGVQFHPEKSGKVGLCILKAFSEIE